MMVKTELVKVLSKEITAKIDLKNVTKFKPTNSFERWARDLKSQLMSYPLCGRRLDLGELKDPRFDAGPNFSPI